MASSEHGPDHPHRLRPRHDAAVRRPLPHRRARPPRRVTLRSRGAPTSILRVRDVRLIVGAVGLSAAGDTVLWILLALHIGATADSALAVSAMFVCLWGPVVALGGVAGRIVDRHENRRLLIGVSIAQAAVVAAIAVSTSSLGALLVLAALLGAGVAAPRGVRADPGGG